MADKKVTRQVSIFINDKEVVNSISGIGRAMAKTVHELRNLNANSEDYEETSKRLKAQLSELTDQQKALKEELLDTNEQMDAAKTAWGNLFNGLMSGNLTSAAAGLTAIKAGLIGTTKAMLAFIATPVGMTIAALAGIALVTKEWLDYNNAVVKANRETEAITKLSGQALDDARVNAQSLANAFDKEFTEILDVASALVNEFGISFDEAFIRIQNGLVKGGAANDEFLESMREYPTFFAQAGYSVEEFQNLLNSGADLSIYQDKLPDAIKEFALSVNEQTPAVREALQNAFGEEFTSTLLKGVKDGSISVKEALVTISEEAQRVGINSQQAAQLTADLFRGAGEDAGGAVKIFNAVTASIENQKRPLNEVEQATNDLVESEKSLAEAQDNALRSEGFDIWKNKALQALNTVKQWFYDTVAVITNSRDQLENIATKNTRGQIIKENSELAIKEFESYLVKLKAAAGKGFNLEEATKNYVATMQDSLKRAIAEKDELEAESIRAEIKAIEAAGIKRKEITNKNNIDDIKARTAANIAKQKELEAQNKKELAEKERLAEAYKKADEEINKLIAKSQSDRALGQLTGLKKEIAQIEAKWATEREKYKDHLERLAELDLEKDAEVAAAKAEKAKEYGKTIDEVNAELDRDREALRLEKLAEEAVEDEDRQAILLEKAQFLADWEIQSEMEKELAMVEDVENAEEMKQAIRDKYALKKQQNDQRFAESEKAIRKDQVKFTEMTEKQKLSFVTGNLNDMSEAFNKGSEAWKAIKIAETSISTFQTAQEAFRGMVSAFPGPVGIALGAVAAAAATVRGIKQIQNIQKTKIEKAPKFYRGGFTGDDILFNDEYGGAVGVVHSNEWVAPAYMTKSPRYANVIGWLEKERIRNNKYADGGLGSPDGPADIALQDPEYGNSLLISAIQTLNAILQNGILAKVVMGYQDVRDFNKLNDEIEQAKRNGTLNS